MWATSVLADSSVPREKPGELTAAWLFKIGLLFGTNQFAIVENRLVANNYRKMYSLLFGLLFLNVSGCTAVHAFGIAKDFLSPQSLYLALVLAATPEGLAYPVVSMIYSQRFAKVMNYVHRVNISDDHRREVEFRCRLFCYFTAFTAAIFTAKMVFGMYTTEDRFLSTGNIIWAWDIMQIAMSFLGGIQFCTSVLLLQAQINELNADVLEAPSNRRCGLFYKTYEDIFSAAVSLNKIYHVPLLALFLASFLDQILGLNLLITSRSHWMFIRSIIASVSMLKLCALISVCNSAHCSVSNDILASNIHVRFSIG